MAYDPQYLINRAKEQELYHQSLAHLAKVIPELIEEGWRGDLSAGVPENFQGLGKYVSGAKCGWYECKPKIILSYTTIPPSDLEALRSFAIKWYLELGYENHHFYFSPQQRHFKRMVLK